MAAAESTFNSSALRRQILEAQLSLFSETRSLSSSYRVTPLGASRRDKRGFRILFLSLLFE